MSEEERRGPGQPTIWNEAVSDEICTRIASGESLSRICKDDHLPARSTILLWITQPEHPFRARYFAARTASGFAFADDVVEAANEIREGTLDFRDARVISENLKWAAEMTAGRWHRKNSAIDHSSEDGSMSPTRIELVPVKPDNADDGAG